MLKHLPKDSLKTIEKNHLYSKVPIHFASTLYDRRNHNSANVVLTGLTAAKQTEKEKHAKDLNIDQRIELFQTQLKNEFVSRIPLRYFSDIRKINFSTKIDYWIKMFLETNMEKLLESRKVLAANAAIPKVNAEIIFTKAPYIQYEQILLDKNFRQHLETILVSKKNIKNGCSKNPNTKNMRNKKRLRLTKCRIFRFKQIIWWIEISIVPDKSDKHTTIYDSYNREMAAQLIKSLRLSNFTEIYSLTNEKKYDVDNLTQRYLPYK